MTKSCTSRVESSWTVSWRIKFVLLCVSTLIGAALFEVAFRAAKLDFNLSPNWKYHPVLGWSQVPGATYDVVLEGRRIRVSFNSAGFRDIEHEKAKPPGVKRLVVIGDSFSEAVQVNLDETFHRRLEGLLNQEEQGDGRSSILGWETSARLRPSSL